MWHLSNYIYFRLISKFLLHLVKLLGHPLQFTRYVIMMLHLVLRKLKSLLKGIDLFAIKQSDNQVSNHDADYTKNEKYIKIVSYYIPIFGNQIK